jgi:glycosyltransferase involved in cell wall biosynthesis
MQETTKKLALNEKDEFEAQKILLKQNFDVIIPAFNEENRIGRVLDEVCSYIQENEFPWKVTVLIDGNDRTEEIVSELSKKYKFLLAVKNRSRSGYGGAIKKGAESGLGEYLIILEADGAMDFKYVVANLHYLRDYDIINFDRHSGNQRLIPLLRRIASRGYNLYIKVLLLDLKVRDIQGGYKVFRMGAAKSLFKKITITDGFFQAALFYHAKEMGLKVIEISVPYEHQQGSKFGMGHMVLGGFVSGIALRLRNSSFYRFIPKSFVELYYRKFRWI